MTAPSPDAWQKLGELRRAILEDIENPENAWARDIAEKRKVTRAVVMALLFTPEATNLCVYCMASGSVQTKSCRHCMGRGYTSEAKS